MFYLLKMILIIYYFSYNYSDIKLQYHYFNVIFRSTSLFILVVTSTFRVSRSLIAV